MASQNRKILPARGKIASRSSPLSQPSDIRSDGQSTSLFGFENACFGPSQKSPSPSVLPQTSQRSGISPKVYNEYSSPSMPPANTGYLESSRSSAYPNRSHLETRFGQRLSPFSTSRADSDSEEPIPSIEKDTPAPANGQLARIESPESSRGSLESEELNHSFRNCEIGTPGGLSTPLPEYRTPTPSISVEPATLSEKSGHLYSAGSIHLPGVFGDLRIGSSPPEPSSPFAASRGRCISPSVHSRSNSNQNRPVYRVEDEEPPEAMFYTGKVQDALQTGKTIMSKMMDLLSNHDSGREAKPAVQNLFQQASELGKFELHSSRTVGLIGDIGVGKSSTINSLLDLGSLAREGSNGGACTSVATEYHYHARDDFVVEVNYFDEEELRLQYEEMLRVYRNHTFSQYQDDKITRDDDNSKEGSATIAITILKESFGEKLNSTPSILSELDFFDAINELVCWASLLLKSHSNSKRMSFVRVEDCSAKLVELTSPRSTFSQAHMSVPACPWPFIKNLKVYSKSYILSQGLILVDLPGLRDSNLARQNVTERYIRNCDHILVVADIGRAVAHQSVKEIFETAERGKLHNISVVCTKSESVKAQEVKTDEPSEQDTISAIESEITMITRISNNIEEAMEHANSDIGFRAMKQARSDINKYRAGKRFELQRHLITVRNRSVSRGLRKKYAEHPAARNLQIFCVSNTMYEEKRHDLVAEVKPHLQLSGIIELRRHCMGISAESYLRQTKEYINHRVSAFVASLELWAQTSLGDMNEERNQQVLQVVSAAQEYTNKLTRPDSRLAALSESLHSEFESCVSLKLRDKKRTVRWVEDAAQIAKKWNKWYASSYKAFCLNFGEHSTKTVRRCSWNELAMSTMFKDMKYIWALFTSSLTDCYNDTRVFIEDSFLELEMDLSRARGKPIFHELLVSTLRFRKSAFLRAIENIVKDFSDGSFLTLQNECLSPLRTAFLGQVMEVTYHEANMEYGRGSDLRRKGRITSRFGSDRLIEDYHSLIRDAFADTAKGLESKVKEAADQYIVFIEADLQIIGDEHAITESSESQEFRSRVAEEVKGTKEVLERINLVCMDEAPN